MKNKPIPTFFYKTSILIIILFVADRLIGAALEHLFYKQYHGDNYVSIYLLEKAKDDIMILGGSRASHNYNASLIEDSTKMSCFNGGRDEMIFYYSAATLGEVYKRTVPKVVILDLIPSELTKSPGIKLALEHMATVLMPFAHRHPDLLKTIALADDKLSLKMWVSHIYPYNSTIAGSIQNGVTSLGHYTVKGYEPLSGVIDSLTYKKSVWGDISGKELLNDSNAISKLNNLICLAKQHQTRMIITVSPFYFPVDFSNSASYLSLKQLAKENNIELYDFSHDPRFLKKPELFYDDIHLNNQGATLFSGVIATIIRENKGNNIVQ